MPPTLGCPGPSPRSPPLLHATGKSMFFFHTNRPNKLFFQTFPSWKMTNFFHTFPDSAGTPHMALWHGRVKFCAANIVRKTANGVSVLEATFQGARWEFTCLVKWNRITKADRNSCFLTNSELPLSIVESKAVCQSHCLVTRTNVWIKPHQPTAMRISHCGCQNGEQNFAMSSMSGATSHKRAFSS